MGATVTTTDHLLLHFARNGGARDGDVELLVLERGEGVFVVDSLGRRHLDGLSNLFCAQLGYSFGPEMAEVASRQLIELPFATNWGVAHPAAVELAGRLAEIAPGSVDHVFFTNGGSESVEAAWKLVRQYHIANGEPQRTKAISRDRAYHGVTLGALAFTGVPGFKEPFGPPAVETFHVSNTNEFRQARVGPELTSRAPRRGERDDRTRGGGDDRDDHRRARAERRRLPATAGRLLARATRDLRSPRDLARRRRGDHRVRAPRGVVRGEPVRRRTRSGHDREGPDIGVRADGRRARVDRVAEPLYDAGRTLLHGITFGGHPLSSVIALKNLELFEREQVFDNVRDNEAYLAHLLESLRRLPIVGDVRGSGYFWAVELVPDGPASRFDAEQREELLRKCLPGALIKAQLIARGDDRGDTVIQIAPPLVCDRPTVDDLVGRLGDVLVMLSEHMGIPIMTAPEEREVWLIPS